MTEKPAITITLTPEQQEQVERVTGKKVPVLALKLESLEERLGPRIAVN
jgi:hypothetical protein